jgi:cyclase
VSTTGGPSALRRRSLRASVGRREFLGGAAYALAAGLTPRYLHAAPALALPDNIVVLDAHGANSTVLATPDALLVVDGSPAEHAQTLASMIEERWPGRRIDVLFNSNWRPEHTGSNALLGLAPGKILAHENTRLWLGADFYVPWEDRHYSAQPDTALPKETFYTSGRGDLGGRAFEYAHLPRAHTDGDAIVFFPDDNILVVSDLLSVGGYPVPDYATGGWIGGLEQATRALIDRTDAQTRIVPAVGAPVVGQAALQSQLDLCTAVRERVADAFRRGMSFADFVATSPTREFDAARGNPDQFLELVYEGAWLHVRELGGII